MDLKLDTIAIVVFTCFVLHSFCEYHNTFVDEDLVKLQIEVVETNIEEIGNAPDTAYSGNISEEEIVRRMLIEYIKAKSSDHLDLLDHLVT